MISQCKEIIAHISPADINENEVKDEMMLVDDLSFDSLAFIDMILTIEEVYGIDFDDEYINMDKLKTVKDVSDYVQIKTIEK